MSESDPKRTNGGSLFDHLIGVATLLIEYTPTLALAHRRRTQTRRAQYALGRAGDGHQPLVIAALGDERQADRHTDAIKAHRQGKRCQTNGVALG